MEKYLAFKRAEGTRSIEEDTTMLGRLKAWFGADTAITEVTSQRIADYSCERATQQSRLKRTVSPATRNRELAVLRHLLRLAEEWGYIVKAPRIRLAKEAEGWLRYLNEPDAVRLLEACAKSQKPYLRTIVTLALHTGMRRGEILGLTWERVDFARGVAKVELTKSGRRREIPMNQPVYDVFVAFPREKSEGLVFRTRSGAAWGSIRTGFERACRAAKITDFRFPRPAAHVRVLARHARPEPQGGSGDPRAPHVHHDPPLRAPEPGSPPRCRRVPGGLQHNVSTKRGRITRASRKSASSR